MVPSRCLSQCSSHRVASRSRWVGGLVEEQQVRAAHQSLCEVQPDAPAARELADRPRQVFGIEPEPVEDPGRARLRGVRVDRLEAPRRATPARRSSPRRSAFSIPRSISRSGRSPSMVHSSALTGRSAISCSRWAITQRRGSFTSPSSGSSRPSRKQEEARLADAVSPHHASAMPGVHGEVHLIEDRPAPALQADVLQMDQEPTRPAPLPDLRSVEFHIDRVHGNHMGRRHRRGSAVRLSRARWADSRPWPTLPSKRRRG